MRLPYLTLLVLLLSSNSIFGQVTIRVDASDPMPAADLSSVIIDENGNMLITSKNGDYQLAKNVAPGDISINSFFINGKTYEDIDSVPATAEITWSTSNAESCVASYEVIQGDAISLSGWSAGTVIGVSSDPSNPVDVTFNEVGEFRLTLTCVDINGTEAVKTSTAKVGAVIMQEFAVTSDPLEPVSGDDVTLTLNWNAINAVSCYGSWTTDPLEELPAVVTEANPVVVNVSAIQPGAEFSLRCWNSIDEKVRTVTLDVSDPGPDCNVTLDTRIVRDWTGSFGAQFPGPSFTRIGFASVPANGYTSYTFATGTVQDDGYVATFQANGTSGNRLITISEVPGCFAVTDARCRASARDTTLEWDTTGASSTACQLKANTTYYWNITFTDGADGSKTTCTSNCYAGLVVNNPDFGD